MPLRRLVGVVPGCEGEGLRKDCLNERSVKSSCKRLFHIIGRHPSKSIANWFIAFFPVRYRAAPLLRRLLQGQEQQLDRRVG